MNLFKLYDFEDIFGFIFTDLTLQEVENLKIEYKKMAKDEYNIYDFIEHLKSERPNEYTTYLDIIYITGIYF